jgi:hypothetical protein
MDRKAKRFLANIGLFASACLCFAGFVGFVIVIRMGILPSGNPMGHTEEYLQGWTLFFLLFLGIPCLLAFFGGLAPLILWFMRFRKKRGRSPALWTLR